MTPFATGPTADPTTTGSTAATGTSTSTSSTGSTSSMMLDPQAFLQLLVAQLKYQDPMSPMDGTQFVTQSAQFTQLETLMKIQKSQEGLAQSSQLLSAATMVGRPVTYGLSQANLPATAVGTTAISVRGTLPKDATTGTKAMASADVFTTNGNKVPLQLQFVKTDGGWTVQAMNDSHPLGSPITINFDAAGDHTTNNISIPADALDQIAGTTGDWSPGGVLLSFGDSNDPTRLQLASGAATVAVAEQNGHDANNATGVVTGIHMTSDGPQLVIGGHDIPLAAVSDVSQ
jgi:flagellar basal-body rod modification protein FlgD